MKSVTSYLFPLLAFAVSAVAADNALDAGLQAKVDAKLKIITEWAAAPAIIDAVKAQNSNPPSTDGTKAAFLSKTTGWSHKGKPKHDLPMSGKSWQGPVEVDESTGLQQVQVAVPVLDGGKPVGSLVVGLSLSKLRGS